MDELPRSSKYRATPDAPVPDAERNQIAERLNAAFTDGKVSSDEYRRLLDVVFDASRLGDLAEVVAVLPGVATHSTPAIVEQGAGRPGEVEPARRPSNTLVTGLVAAGALSAIVLVIVVLMLLL